jgi:hypothetical protein
VTPVVVVLREYAAQREANPNLSILDFVRATAHAAQQWPSIPRGAFEYLLASGRAAVFFDGLDELLDTGARRAVTAAVEAFARRYANVPILVTSREVGYAEAALEPTEFATFVLDGFTRDDARTYVLRRFQLEDGGTTDECAAMVDAFMRESEPARDLRSNPLMLGLLCTIYRGEGYIPQHRPGVYEKCALMLFERWDRRRRIATRFSYDEDLGPIVQHLAYWIYAEQALQNGVPEDRLIQATANYLWPRRFEDRDRAVAFAREFVEHCRGLAWVFTDVGSTGAGDPLYQFTHRTFLEYFAAAHLVRQHPTPERLSLALLPRITRIEWDVVAQLAIQIQSRQVEDAASEHLTPLLQSADIVGPGPAASVIAFAARLLAFLTPAPAVVRGVVAAALRQAVAVWPMERARGLASRRSGIGADRNAVAGTLLQALIGVTAQNHGTAVAEVERVCLQLCADPKQRSTAIVFGATLDSVAQMGEGDGRGEHTELWRAAAGRIYEAARPHLTVAASESFAVAQILAVRGDATPEDLIRWHGPGAPFLTPEFHPLGFFLPTSADQLLGCLGGHADAAPLTSVLEHLRALGRGLRAAAPPWVRVVGGARVMFDLLPLRRFNASGIELSSNRRPAPLPPDAWDPDLAFGLFALAAVVTELRELASERPAGDAGAARKSGYMPLEDLPAFGRLRMTVAAHRFPLFTSAAIPEMEAAGLSETDRAFISRWHEGDVQLVMEPPPSAPTSQTMFTLDEA